MINVTILNNTSSTQDVFTPDTTIREVFTQKGIDYARGTNTLDGAPLMPGDLDRSLESFGITDSCYLSSVVKLNNA